MQLCLTHMNSNVALITLLSATQITMLFVGLRGLFIQQQVSTTYSNGLGLPKAPKSGSADLLLLGIVAWTWYCSEQGHASAGSSVQTGQGAESGTDVTLVRAVLEPSDGAL